MNLDAMNASLRKQLYQEMRKEMHHHEKTCGWAGGASSEHECWRDMTEWLDSKIEREDRRLRGD